MIRTLGAVFTTLKSWFSLRVPSLTIILTFLAVVLGG
jgi:hypothetical protein